MRILGFFFRLIMWPREVSGCYKLKGCDSVQKAALAGAGIERRTLHFLHERVTDVMKVKYTKGKEWFPISYSSQSSSYKFFPRIMLQLIKLKTYAYVFIPQSGGMDYK